MLHSELFCFLLISAIVVAFYVYLFMKALRFVGFTSAVLLILAYFWTLDSSSICFYLPVVYAKSNFWKYAVFLTIDCYLQRAGRPVSSHYPEY